MTNTIKAVNPTSCILEPISIATIMNPKCFDLEQSYYDKSRGMYCFVVDKQLFEDMDNEQKRELNVVLEYITPYGYNPQNLEGKNLTVLCEYEDTEGFNPAKEVNLCFYDLDRHEIITRDMRWDKMHPFSQGTKEFPDSLWESRKQLYTEWERIGKTLQVRNSKLQSTDKKDKYAIVKIEPTLKFLYAELKDFDLYFFNHTERDNNGHGTFYADMVMTKMKLDGRWRLLFSNGRCEFSIFTDITKIEKQLYDDSCGIEYAGYNYTIFFKDSNIPLKFSAGKVITINPQNGEQNKNAIYIS